MEAEGNRGCTGRATVAQGKKKLKGSWRRKEKFEFGIVSGAEM